ncbi:hypothetical protein BDV93DRAFT_609553 [Ceratobasidium sp. AG-I]|nr:hypothetical protein BDV93DRAFT_609553 [Ceratobasidium sp. AG-I]
MLTLSLTQGRECSWSPESDARRPVTKQLVESLRVKIQLLEAEVARLSADQVATTSGNPSTAPRQLIETPVRFEESLPNSPSHSTIDPAGGRLLSEPRLGITPILSCPIPSSPRPSQPEQPDDSFDVERSHPPSARLINIPIYQYIFQINTSIPTSEQPQDVRLTLACEWDRHLPQLDNIQLTRFDHDVILHRYFTYGASWLLCLVPEFFFHDMLYFLSAESESHQLSRLQHYSPLLHCSILAFACAFSDNPAISAPATRAKFSTFAKQWLDEEFKRPRMSLVRALALLAEYHCGVGERDAGYMYMGMSFRAARALKLNGDSGLWGGEGILAFPDSLNRDWHFWSAFAQDKIMALDYEREYDIPMPRPGDSLPSINNDLDSQPWLSELAPTSGPNTSPANMRTKTFLETCKLTVISTRVIDAVLHQGPNFPEERAVINIHLQLDTWFNNLPEDMLVWARTTSPLPHVIVLHVCYWWLIITLHHSFYQKTHAPEQDPRLSITDLSVKMCDRAAHKIVQLINMFNERHGIRYFPRSMLKAIFTAGLALLRESASAPSAAAKKRAYAQENTRTCVHMLHILGQTWPYAHELSSELQSRLSDQSQFPVTSLQNGPSPFMDMRGKGPALSNDGSNDQEWDDPSTADLSQTFYRFVHEWERAQSFYLDAAQHVPDTDSVSESPLSHPADIQ